MEIDEKQLETARRNPEVKKFLEDALKQDRMLEREGLIHR
jgi:hypothetical protein